jgi:hypothetical protein
MVINLQWLILSPLLGLDIPTIGLSLLYAVLAFWIYEKTIIVKKVLYGIDVSVSVRCIGPYFHLQSSILFALCL